MVSLDEEGIALAQKYIDEKIIPIKYRDDAFHIALATLNACTALVSWNFQHIVKLKTILGVNVINRMLWYQEIEILTPQSFITEKENE